MYCGSCGAQIDANSKYCQNCGTEVAKPPEIRQTPTKKRKVNFKKLVIGSILVVVGLIFLFVLIDISTRIDGSYKSIVSDRVILLEETDTDEGTFSIFEGGNPIDRKNMRYKKTWKRVGDVLTLEYDDDSTWYYLVIEEGLIKLDDEDELPDFAEYIAPEGDTFEYEIDGVTFHEDGTYEYTMSYYGTATGKYYRKDNVIYCMNDSFRGTESKFGNIMIYPGDDKYSARYYIYNEDYITRASNVYLEK